MTEEKLRIAGEFQRRILTIKRVLECSDKGPSINYNRDATEIVDAIMYIGKETSILLENKLKELEKKFEAL